MARTEKVIMTNMCMVFSENRLLVQDKRDDDYSGITFPGGHVERGESFTDAVIREVWEETGLKISEPKLCGIKDWMKDEETRYIVLLYKTDKFEGIVTSSEEGDVFWLILDEMKQRKLAYGMDKMLEVFGGILIRNGKILLQRPKNDDYSIIGGHVAAMETSIETLKREFEEELHTKIEVDNLLAIGEIYFPWGKRPCHQICLYY